MGGHAAARPGGGSGGSASDVSKLEARAAWGHSDAVAVVVGHVFVVCPLVGAWRRLPPGGLPEHRRVKGPEVDGQCSAGKVITWTDMLERKLCIWVKFPRGRGGGGSSSSTESTWQFGMIRMAKKQTGKLTV